MRGEDSLRPATEMDADILLDMLVEAVSWPPERQLPHSTVVTDPALIRNDFICTVQHTSGDSYRLVDLTMSER